MDDLARKLNEGKLYLRRPIHEILPPRLLLHLIPPLPPLRLVLAVLLAGLLVLLRIWWILPARENPKSQNAPKKVDGQRGTTVAVFLGSGGHTTELLQLVSALPTERYTQRIYLVSSGDRFSLDKAKELEIQLASSKPIPSDTPIDSFSAPKVIQIPRARKVHQSFLTTPFTLARSIAFCLDHVALRPLLHRSSTHKDQRRSTHMLADVVLMNGPGTCVPIVAAVYLLRVSRLPSTHLQTISFVEES